MAHISFTADAIDDLRRIGPSAVPKVLRKLLILEENTEAGYPLGGELTGFRKLVVGRNTWRIVYRIDGDTIEVCEVWAVGARADAAVYADALARVRAAANTRPQLVALVELMEQLGRLADGVAVATVPPPVEQVPDWLADRLVYTAGWRREEVAAMDLQRAVDAWAKFTAEPQDANYEG